MPDNNATSSPDDTPQSRSALIKAQALALGFHKAGIAAAEKLETESENFSAWLRLGYHADMAWLERAPLRRTDPREIFPAARAMVCLALNYYTPHQHTNAPGTGKISRYAWGDDYHDVVGEKLKELLAWIKTRWPEAEGKACVDIQPVMDKAWAVRAGLGWLGKHSNVITREYGSWVFLGELLLNLELAYDAERVPDHCGSCNACLDACPTQAIVAPYVVDSNRCLSYATIESRAPELPVSNTDGWLYGCDVCQDVCPWNRFQQDTDEARFTPRPGLVDADLPEILELTPETYAARFRRSAIKRAKLSGLRRNARALQTKETIG
jgi:epoxyqueuosine reductase